MKITIILQKILQPTAPAKYKAVDDKGRVLGFLVPKTKGKNRKIWGFKLFETSGTQRTQYVYKTRTEALNALILIRSVNADTSSIPIIK